MSRTMNILIVEDDENVRRFLRLLLSEEGHAVEEAANGQEGLARAREHRPDLIISDGLMPVMDGFQFLQALKADPGLSSIPFIFLSAVFTGRRELDLARSLGASAFLVKPQPPAVILEAVKAATANPPATAPGVAGGAEKLAEEYSRIVATLLEEKVRQLETATAELERTQADLRESEAIYRGLFENSPQPMWVYDLESLAFRAVNDAAVRKYGFSRQEFLGMTIKDIRPPEEAPALLGHLAVTREGFDDAGTWKHRKKDGTIIDVEITSHTLPFLGRKAELVLANDVTERTRLEKAIRHASDEWRATFDAMTEAVALLDADGRVQRCNKSMTSLVNKPYSEIIGRACAEMCACFGGSAEACPFLTSKKTLKRESMVFNRGDQWVEATTDPIVDAAGALKGAVHILQDITERKRAENELLDTKLSMEAIIKASPLPIFTLDHEGKVMMWNQAAERTFGWTSNEAIGQVNPIVPEEKRGEFYALFKQLIGGEKLGTLELRRRRKDGTLLDVKVSTSRIHSASGAVTGLMSIVEDVSEQKRAVETLRRTMMQQKAILTNIPDIAWLKDVESRFIAVNEPFAKACGWKPDDLAGKSDLDIWPAELASRYQADDREVMLSRKRKTVEEPLVDATGRTTWIETIKTPILNEKGEVIGTTGIARDITERRRMEMELNAAVVRAEDEKARSDSIIAAIGDGISIQDRDFRILYENEAQKKMVGDHVGEPCYLAYEKREERCEGCGLAQVFKDGGTHVVERSAPTDKGLVHVEITASPLRDAKGNIIAGIEIVHNITERKKMEDRLREQQRITENMIMGSAIATFVLDAEHKVLIWNKACEELTGVPAAEMAGTSNQWKPFYDYDRPVLADIVLGRQPERLALLYSDVSASELLPEGLHAEDWFKDLNGKARYVVFDAAPIRDSAGAVIAAIETLQDITERKTLEEKIYRSQQDWEHTFNSITDMVTVHDKDYNIILANKAAEKILNLPMLEKMKDRKCFAYYHGTDHAPEGCPSCGCLQTGASASFELFEPHLNMFIEIRAIPRFDSEKSLIGLIHVVRDITERKQLERQIKMHTEHLETVVQERTRALEDANRELRTVNRELVLRREEADAASRSKTDFLANMSHELRTPLNAIMGFSEIMLMGMAGPISEKQKEFLGDISKSGSHLLSLINDILDLSKVEAGKVEPDLGQVIISNLISGSLMMLKEKALKHAIKIESIIDPAATDIIGDQRMLKQVLVNLLSNALKFTPHGGSVSVQARMLNSSELPLTPALSPTGRGGADDIHSELHTPHSALHGNFIEVSVSDTGVGITPEHQQKLFQPFQQIDSSLTRKHAGTGLGLSLCRRFVELHGGRIWVESEPGKGSTFRFVVPVRQA